ncbi:uncharacterized protein LOC143214917 [Lasioglossum baleicum]|uniref:uncharacterized protein LOC143214917 n=1 Tax=Lasioglossum baleicum TaxID=434251 RepID=UPI003FCDF9E6
MSSSAVVSLAEASHALWTAVGGDWGTTKLFKICQRTEDYVTGTENEILQLRNATAKRIVGERCLPRSFHWLHHAQWTAVGGDWGTTSSKVCHSKNCLKFVKEEKTTSQVQNDILQLRNATAKCIVGERCIPRSFHWLHQATPNGQRYATQFCRFAKVCHSENCLKLFKAQRTTSEVQKLCS